MGVHGLWRLIEPSGKPVPLETLENKTLAVDVSIWLHQAVKGFQDSKGAALPNAHLLGIFHRVCKLLYFRIKPVFVFDGGVPVLKKQTIAKRNQIKSKNTNDANRIQKQLISTLLKHSAVNKVITGHVKTNIENGQKKSEATDMYELPPSQLDVSSSSDEECSSSDTTESSSPTKTWDLHTIDVKSANFKNLPADVRHEILTELKEKRKQNSWGRIHELPTQSDDFSGYQMQRLLKRFSVQAGLEEAEKEMGGVTLSLGELETLLNDHGVVTSTDKAKRIASNENNRYILIKDLKKAIENATNQKTIEEISDETSEESKTIAEQSDKIIDENNSRDMIEQQAKTIADLEYEDDLEKAIQLSLQDVPSTSNSERNLKDDFPVLNEYESESSGHSDEEEDPAQKLSSAKNYMMEYSGLTPAEILRIISGNSKKISTKKPKIAKLNLTEDVLSNIELDKDKISKPVALENNEEVSAIKENADAILIDTDIHSKKINEKQQESVIDSECQSKTIDEHEIVELMSDSDDSGEFVDVDETDTKSPDLKKAFEVVINCNTEIEEDDLFSDIFSGNIKDEGTCKGIINNKNLEAPIEKAKEIMNTEISTEDKLELDERKLTGTIDNKNIEETGEKAKQIINPETSSTENKREPDEPKRTETIDQPNKESILLKEVLHSANLDASASISKEQLKSIETNLMIEKQDLLAKQSMKERLATNITDQIYQEAQELLELFGVPFVVAPMEAEAQCAFLDEMNLTDGTITDDSDIWLFGGKTVYKNFFNQAKRVMEFRAENIQHSFKLTRYEMILLALLVGSDYTTGVQGVGPVTALEILANFPSKKGNELILSQDQLVSGLRDFRRWITGDRTGLPGRATLRNKLKNVSLGDHFPSLAVVQAYLEPTVETSDEQFSWGKPDLVSLIDYAKEKFGWNQSKSEEILKPVLKRLKETDIQSKITSYYQRKHKLVTVDEDKMSKRVKKAVEKIGKPGSTSEEEVTKEVKEKTKPVRKVETKSKPKVEKKSKPRVENKTKPEVEKTSKRKISKATIETVEKVSKEAIEKPSEGEPSTSALDISSIIDEEIKLLQQTKKISRRRVKQIENEMRYELEHRNMASTSKDPKTLVSRQLHTKEVIPQKQQEKADVLRKKMKAIEVFRKSKQGPGYVPKRQRKKAAPKDDAELSEDSNP